MDLMDPGTHFIILIRASAKKMAPFIDLLTESNKLHPDDNLTF